MGSNPAGRAEFEQNACGDAGLLLLEVVFHPITQVRSPIFPMVLLPLTGPRRGEGLLRPCPLPAESGRPRVVLLPHWTTALWNNVPVTSVHAL